MATMKRGTTAKPWGSYCQSKHLRPDGKRGYWHRERRAAQRMARSMGREPWRYHLHPSES